MAKKRNKRRGWTGAPAPRPSGGASRPQGSAGTQASGGAGSVAPGAVTTEGPAPAGSGDGRPTQTIPTGQKPPKAAAPVTPTSTSSQPTVSNRTARKEEARRQREMIRKKEARRRAMRKWGIIAAVVVAVGAVVAFIVLNSGPKELKAVDPNDLSGINTGPAPWPVETANLSKRLDEVGLPPPGAEQTEVHFHQNLLVYVNGTREPVPTGIGTLPDGSLAEIHTHDNTGTIHVEAAASRKFSLGLPFDVWGVRFSWGDKPGERCLGSYCEDENNKFRVYVGGELQTGNPRNIPLEDQQVIVVTYGTEDQLPDPIPSLYIYAGDPANPGASPTTGATSGPGTSGATSAPPTSGGATSAPPTTGAATSGPTG